MEQDINLRGNDRIESALSRFCQRKSEQRLADVLMIIKSRRDEGGHFLIAVNEEMSLRTITLPDNTVWFAAFTSVDEQLKKKDRVVSGFTAEIEKIFDLVMTNENVSGVILNPWGDSIKIDRNVIDVIN